MFGDRIIIILSCTSSIVCQDLTMLIKCTNVNDSKVTKNFTFSENENMDEICNYQQIQRSVGENVTFTTLLSANESCLFVFKHRKRYITCCYSNRDREGECSPNTQSQICRKGVQKPILIASGNSCTFHIPFLLPSDDGDYLSNFKQGTPQFKSNLKVNSSSFLPGMIIFMIVLALMINDFRNDFNVDFHVDFENDTYDHFHKIS